MSSSTSQYKLVLFDMDGTLLHGRSIFIIAEKKGFYSQLQSLMNTDKEPLDRSIDIARLLKGLSYADVLMIFRQIPLQPHVHIVVNKLKENNIRTAVVTDSYQCFANDLQHRLRLDYAFANTLVIENDYITGSLIAHNQTLQRCTDGKQYSICKQAVLESLCKTLHITPQNVIAVGDGLVDRDMIKAAGLGIAYRAPQEVQKYADVSTDDLRIILEYV